jgi:hypothetical protein
MVKQRFTLVGVYRKHGRVPLFLVPKIFFGDEMDICIDLISNPRETIHGVIIEPFVDSGSCVWKICCGENRNSLPHILVIFGKVWDVIGGDAVWTIAHDSP